MKIALLTNSKIAVPAIDFLAGKEMLVATGIPAKKEISEDLDHIRYSCHHHQVPVQSFSFTGLSSQLDKWLLQYRPDAVLIFTFPYKIPSEILAIPPHGFINFHFGLLPQYRGADAIFWEIKNREKEGGISVHQVTSEIDRGPLYLRTKIPLFAGDTYGSHLVALSLHAVEALEKMIGLLVSGNKTTFEQEEAEAGYYNRPALADLIIDWEKPAAEIIAVINAANPWNRGAVAYFGNYPVKIIQASAVPLPADAGPKRQAGLIIKSDEQGCFVCCGENELLSLNIIFCNDSFITGSQFAQLGIQAGTVFRKMDCHQVA